MKMQVYFYQLLERIVQVVYRLALSPNLFNVHNVFHVSQLRKCHSDPSHVIKVETIDIYLKLTFTNDLLRSLIIKIEKLRSKVNPLVKILWRSPKYEEETWETEESMRLKYQSCLTQVPSHSVSYYFWLTFILFVSYEDETFWQQGQL